MEGRSGGGGVGFGEERVEETGGIFEVHDEIFIFEGIFCAKF
jgi:hypothetical protein